MRTCILSREESPREGLIRLALSPDGDVLPDVRAKAPGRGAWIGVARAELEAAQAKGKLRGALSRAFKTQDLRIPDDLGERIETQLQRNVLDRLGLEAKAGHGRRDGASGLNRNMKHNQPEERSVRLLRVGEQVRHGPEIGRAHV